MKIIAIGDIHGRDSWKKIVEEENSADKIVFVGDYFDTHESISAGKQMQNFREILDFKRKNKEKVVLLIGNHDYHYMGYTGEIHYSGYQYSYEYDIKELVKDALSDGSIQMAFQADGFVYTHAGITKTWANYNNIKGEHVADEINKLFLSTPRMFFEFTEGFNRSNYGDDICQTPIWVRPNSLLSDRIDTYSQVVGHTTMNNVRLVYEGDRGIAFIDTLGKSGEYISVIDGEISLMKPIKK